MRSLQHEVQTEDPGEKENSAPQTDVHKVDTSLGRKASPKRRKSKRGSHSVSETKEVNGDTPSLRLKDMPQIHDKAQVEDGGNAALLSEMARAAVKKTNRKRGPKRPRHGQADQEHVHEQGGEPQSRPPPKKAMKSAELARSITNRPTNDARPGAKRKRAPKRRSQTAAEPLEVSTRRRSLESAGGQGATHSCTPMRIVNMAYEGLFHAGEYCGEFALED